MRKLASLLLLTALGRPIPLHVTHQHIIATVFWVGEAATPENNFIPNNVSSWDDCWQEHYGGIDDPEERNGFYPKGFVPKENPFYIALPAGNEHESYKNWWVKISYNGKVCYAQWEDVGPFEDDDYDYVFGTARPKNKEHGGAGIDVSPAVRDQLRMTDEKDYVDWMFINPGEVPQGPWKEIITK